MIIKNTQPTSYGLFYGPTLLTTAREVVSLKYWADSNFSSLGELAAEAGLVIKALGEESNAEAVQFVSSVCKQNQEHYWRGV